jgi:hypothetical protein
MLSMYQRHFDALEAVPAFRNAHVFVYIENNSSFITADAIQTAIQQRGTTSLHIHFVNRDQLGRAGVRTDDNLKEAMMFQLSRDLSRGAIRIARDFVSCSVNDPEIVVMKLAHQLKSFQKVPRQTQYKPGRQEHTGYRITGKKVGPDDIGFTLMHANYMAALEIVGAQYQRMAQMFGWGLNTVRAHFAQPVMTKAREG